MGRLRPPPATPLPLRSEPTGGPLLSSHLHADVAGPGRRAPGEQRPQHRHVDAVEHQLTAGSP